MTHHYPDLGSTSDWLKQIYHTSGPVRSTTQIWVVIHHQNEISTLVSQMPFHGENQMTAVFSGYVRWYQLCTKQLLISYSASGKSGQIQFLTLYLQALEQHILVITLWERRGEVVTSCCHLQQNFWMTTNRKIKSLKCEFALLFNFI